MQFLWFDWDDPKGSIFWSLLAILIGVVSSIPILMVLLGFGTPNLPRFVWELVGLGVSVALFGLMTLMWSAAAWLASLYRGYN